MNRKLVLLPASISLLAGSAIGQVVFQTGVNYVTASRPGGVAAGDFNGDGARDLAVTTNTPDKIGILLNNGTGVFAAPINILVPNGAGPGAIIAADLDGDHDIDLAVAYQNFGQVQVFLNNGTGFTAGAIYAVGANPRGLLAAHLNADSAIDLAVANSDSNTVSVLLNDGSGGFTVNTFPVGTDPRSLAAGDITGDGFLNGAWHVAQP